MISKKNLKKKPLMKQNKNAKKIIQFLERLVKATRTTTYSAVMELRGWPAKRKIDSFFICIALFI